jgi:Tol biopolymer transport system component
MRRAPLAGALVLLLAGCGSTPGTIAFTSTRDGNADVYVMRADGSHVRNLTHNLAQDGQPSWSPDGRRIAFVSARDGNLQIFVMNADGSGQRRVTRSNDGDSAPVWSPDGRKIAFMCTSVTPRLVTEICVVNVDGSRARKLTSPAQRGDNLYPQWVGSKVISFTRSNGRYSVLGIGANGSGEQLFQAVGDVAELVYAPSDVTFAYLKRPVGGKWALYVRGRRVWSGAGNADSPAWSPDGQRLAFAVRVSHSDLYAVERDGSGGQRLTHGPGNSLSPRWSPDGRSIAFERLRGNSSQVFTVKADGTGERQLTREGKNGGPVWRP